MRLLTLIGPGGVGKTTLARHLMRLAAPSFPDGTLFVELAPIVDPTLVWPTVARSLGLADSDGPDEIDLIADHLRDARFLLVLDNVEQVVSAGKDVPVLLARCPGLKIIVTSRIALRLADVHAYNLSPLAVPDPATTPIEQLFENAAVQLFAQRAQSIRPDFRLTYDNVAIVAEICARLDGLPLAIELAAARIRLLSPQALLARLSGRLRLLTEGPLDAPARTRTMRGAIAWSYDLLTPLERAVFRQIAMFTGGFTVEAAEAVCLLSDQDQVGAHAEIDGAGYDPLILDTLASLIDKSLLRSDDGPHVEPRLTMLETVREFALQQLESTGETETIARRHAEYMLELLRQAGGQGQGSLSTAWLARLDDELNNARAAMLWAIARDEAEIALRLAAGLDQFWTGRGQLREGRSWLEESLALAPNTPSAARGWALISLERIAWRQGALKLSEQVAEEALAVFRTVEERGGIAAALRDLGTAVSDAGDLVRGAALYEEALPIFLEVGDQRGAAILLNNLGVTADTRRDWPLASSYFEQALNLLRTLSDQSATAIVLQNLGDVRRQQGDYASAAASYAESVDLWRRIGDPWGLACTLPGVAILADLMGDQRRAARLFGAAEGLMESVGGRQQPMGIDVTRLGLITVRAQLGEDTFEAELTHGRNLSMDEAVHEATLTTRTGTIEASVDWLSASQLRRAIAEGHLIAHFQPQYDLRTKRLVGVEALVRWQHPVHGVLSPAVFLSLAEETGLIVPLDYGVWEEACRQAQRWNALTRQPIMVSANMSARHLREPEFVEQIARLVKATGADPATLKLEITEQATIDDIQLARRRLQAVRDLGVKIAIDDFGIGYSSLNYLRQLPADTIKIDRSFVSRVESEARDRRILEAMTTLAHDLGMDVTAEGVETQAQSQILGDLGCDWAQGYYWSKPLPPEAIPLLITEASQVMIEPERQPAGSESGELVRAALEA